MKNESIDEIFEGIDLNNEEHLYFILSKMSNT